MKLEKGLQISGFCCPGFDWHVFEITDDTVYSECDNPDCSNRNVYLEEFGDIDALKQRLANL